MIRPNTSWHFFSLERLSHLHNMSPTECRSGTTPSPFRATSSSGTWGTEIGAATWFWRTVFWTRAAPSPFRAASPRRAWGTKVGAATWFWRTVFWTRATPSPFGTAKTSWASNGGAWNTGAIVASNEAGRELCIRFERYGNSRHQKGEEGKHI